MSLESLYLDYNIDIASEGHKHHREDWVNVACPYCSGEHGGYHLGFNISQHYFFCWRCGSHPIVNTLMKLIQVDRKQAIALSRDYRVRQGGRKVSTANKHIKLNKDSFKLPSGIIPLNKAHNRYLEKRNFDPEELVEKWGIQGTSPTSMLDGIPYKYRILIPIYWQGKLVTFQTRDYTNRQELKYMACPKKREVIHHKHLIYGNDKDWSEVGICVEGVFDVWRLGSQAFSTLGIGYTSEQVDTIVSIFKGKKVFIIFDPEKQAKAQAKKLQEELQFKGVDAYNYTKLDTDPADLSPEDAGHLLKELGL